jgi:hypothetical protein
MFALAASSRCPRTTSTVVRESAIQLRWSPAAIQNGLGQDACTSIKNANVSIAGTHLVRVTHPFHPLSGQQLVCRGKRYNRYGMTLLLEIEDGSVCSVPPQWTDLVAPDPEIVLGERRALFRVVDLLELARLVERLRPDNTQEE